MVNFGEWSPKKKGLKCEVYVMTSHLLDYPPKFGYTQDFLKMVYKITHPPS